MALHETLVWHPLHFSSHMLGQVLEQHLETTPNAWSHRVLRMQALAYEVACNLGLDLGHIKIKRFADGEIYVQVQVSYVRALPSRYC